MPTLTDQDLADLQQDCLGYFETPSHSDLFRAKAAEAAALIGLHLAGQGDDDRLAHILEELLGHLAEAEVQRLERYHELDLQLVQAYEADDAETWVRVFGQVLPLLSEAHQFALMALVSEAGLADDDLPEDPLQHPMPEVAQ
jgi:hypothetical protein